jgi:structural maintenance of chromosome 4
MIQEVKAAAAEAVKDLATHEKKGVGLEERRKHTNAKAKKLKKSMQEVSNLIFQHELFVHKISQDEHAKREAIRSIEDNAEKIENQRKKAEDLEAELDKEESVLEGIQDSLKGNENSRAIIFLYSCISTIR